MDDIHDIANFYDNTLEKESSRLERHQLEYELTLRVLDQYLPKSGSILEIGAATGQYTQVLAQKGYQVTAVDLSTELLKRCQENIENAGLGKQVQYVVADARNLSSIAEKDYDAVLLMGPLYHLVEEEDRQLALQQVYERLRTGGILLSAFISRYGMLGDLMKKIPEWIEDKAEVRSVMERGKDPDDYPRGGFRGYFVRVPEIAPLHEDIGFETLALIGVEPAISADDESYNRLEGKQRQLWLDLLYEVSTEKSTIGASRHLLYVGRK